MGATNGSHYRYQVRRPKFSSIMPHRYSTALSHIILAGAGLYCLGTISKNAFTFPQVTFGIISINSLLGVWRWGNPSYGDKADSAYRLTSFLQTIFALPCITTALWLQYGYMWELAYAHSCVSLIPMIAYLTDHAPNELAEAIVGVNSISCGVVSFLEQNYFGIATAVSFAIAQFCIKNEGSVMDIPAQDLYNYGLCFFALFALRALKD